MIHHLASKRAASAVLALVMSHGISKGAGLEQPSELNTAPLPIAVQPIIAELDRLYLDSEEQTAAAKRRLDYSKTRLSKIEGLFKRGKVSYKEALEAREKTSAAEAAYQLHRQYAQEFATLSNNAFDEWSRQSHLHAWQAATIAVPGISQQIGGHVFFSLPIQVDSKVVDAAIDYVEQQNELLAGAQTINFDLAMARHHVERLHSLRSGSHLEKLRIETGYEAQQAEAKQFIRSLEPFSHDLNTLHQLQDELSKAPEATTVEVLPWLANDSPVISQGWRRPLPSGTSIFAASLEAIKARTLQTAAIELAELEIELAAELEATHRYLRRKGLATQIELERTEERRAVAEIDLQIEKQKLEVARATLALFENAADTSADEINPFTGRTSAHHLLDDPVAYIGFAKTLCSLRDADIEQASSDEALRRAQAYSDRLSTIASASQSEKKRALLHLRIAQARQKKATQSHRVAFADLRLWNQLNNDACRKEIENGDFTIPSHCLSGLETRQRAEEIVHTLQRQRANLLLERPERTHAKLVALKWNGGAFDFEVDRANWKVQAAQGYMKKAFAAETAAQSQTYLLSDLADHADQKIIARFSDLGLGVSTPGNFKNPDQEGSDLILASYQARTDAYEEALSELYESGHASRLELESARKAKHHVTVRRQTEEQRHLLTQSSANLTRAIIETNSPSLDGPVASNAEGDRFTPDY